MKAAIPISPSQGQWIPMRDRYDSPWYVFACTYVHVRVCVCVCTYVAEWLTKKKGTILPGFVQTWMRSRVGFFFSIIFFFMIILPRSFVSMTSGSLLFPVHRSLIKPSNEEVMHNFICSSSTWGHFLTSLKSMIVSFWKAITLFQ